MATLKWTTTGLLNIAMFCCTAYGGHGAAATASAARTPNPGSGDGNDGVGRSAVGCGIVACGGEPCSKRSCSADALDMPAAKRRQQPTACRGRSDSAQALASTTATVTNKLEGDTVAQAQVRMDKESAFLPGFSESAPQVHHQPGSPLATLTALAAQASEALIRARTLQGGSARFIEANLKKGTRAALEEADRAVEAMEQQLRVTREVKANLQVELRARQLQEEVDDGCAAALRELEQRLVDDSR